MNEVVVLKSEWGVIMSVERLMKSEWGVMMNVDGVRKSEWGVMKMSERKPSQQHWSRNC